MNNGQRTTENGQIQVTFCAYDGRGELNGPNVWLARMLPQLRARGIDARVLFLLSAPPNECPTLQALQVAGVPCHFTPRQRSTSERVRWLLHELRAAPPDVFVPNVVVPAYYAARWVRAAGISTLGILHSDDDFHHALLERFVWGRDTDRLSALVCVSQALAMLAGRPTTDDRRPTTDDKETRRQENSGQQTTGNGQRTRIIRIPYGVHVPNETAKPPAERFRLMYAGRLDEEQKRISVVVRAMCRAARELPGVEGVIYGAGHALPAVQAILANEGANLPVRLGGELPPGAVRAAMLDSHALVLLSAYEGLPIALMEAMACGLVPICTPMRSGISELVRDGENGLLVDDGDRAFVEAVRRLRNEPGLWTKWSAAARATIAASYDEQSCVDAWVALLRELSAHRSHGMIEVPHRLALPPPHWAFRREDHRGPPLLADAIRRGRYVLGELRRRIREHK